jgi:hypothetical protein
VPTTQSTDFYTVPALADELANNSYTASPSALIVSEDHFDSNPAPAKPETAGKGQPTSTIQPKAKPKTSAKGQPKSTAKAKPVDTAKAKPEPATKTKPVAKAKPTGKAMAASSGSDNDQTELDLGQPPKWDFE